MNKLPEVDKTYVTKNGDQIRVRLFAFDFENEECVVYNRDGKNYVVKMSEFWDMFA